MIFQDNASALFLKYQTTDLEASVVIQSKVFLIMIISSQLLITKDLLMIRFLNKYFDFVTNQFPKYFPLTQEYLELYWTRI